MEGLDALKSESYAEFLITLQVWGKWSRGGLPRYRCPLAPQSGDMLPIDPDTAQQIDGVLAKIKFIFGDYKTEAFEAYYIGGQSIADIGRKQDKARYKVTAEIQEIESLLYFTISRE